MKKITIKVNGMHCTGCENRIEKSLLSMKEVSEVKANHERGTVEITMEESAINQVKERLSNIGFPVCEEL